MGIEVLKTCIGCTKCVTVCPFGAISMVDKKAVIDLTKCTLCGACVSVCPVKSIVISREAEKKDLSGYKDVWVFVEFSDNSDPKQQGEIKKVSFELLSEGRKLADKLNNKLCAVLLTDKNRDYEKILSDYGVDKVYLVENDEFLPYDTDVYSTAVMALINKYKPAVFLYPATYKGRDLAPRIAANLYVGLTADCTALDINKDGLLVQSRPAFGGNIMADILSPNSRPQMATVRPNVMKIEKRKSGNVEIVKEDIKIGKNIRRVSVVRRNKEEHTGHVKIENAEIIVSGGRGLKTKERFDVLHELAEILSASVGASRAAVDSGFIDKKHQVGQSGTTVRPRLYLAFGISGAIQHLVGMKNSDIIIAINKDPNAPIFGVSKYAVVGDGYDILKKLIEKLSERKEKVGN
ncbi:MAG: FAD-binding protein [Elusimicrobiales bacterium]|nr:FAD-binding protein [Elusimicrobiales bacterium]HOL62226.1 FAD-binding protein [Elusimicrobiales bacterium]HPO94873.1 FAD-binding protein [Elusimicrobiales bacterium]